MKANGTHLFAACMQLVLLVGSIPVFAQPKYNFQNAIKISGADRQKNAKYRFSNVRTGTDALVTITDITGGITLDELDGTSSGFDEAFQPVITAPAHSTGYVEFTIVFVKAGTSTSRVQTEVPVTPIDVDGQKNIVYEYDDIALYSSSYVNYGMLGGELNISYPSANWVEGKNSAGVDYSGVDTSAKDVMFTVVNANISTLVVRTGADNKSGSSQQRLRSLYFQKFTYPNSILSQSLLPVNNRNENARAAEEQPLKVFPSSIKGTVTLKINAGKTGTATFRLIDYSGRTLKQQPVIVQAGANNIVINDLDHIIPGNYIVLLSIENKQLNQKVIKL